MIVAEILEPFPLRMLLRCPRCTKQVTGHARTVVGFENDGTAFVDGTYCSDRCALQTALAEARGDQ